MIYLILNGCFPPTMSPHAYHVHWPCDSLSLPLSLPLSLSSALQMTQLVVCVTSSGSIQTTPLMELRLSLWN